MKNKPYCIIPNWVLLPNLNYKSEDSYSTLKEAMVAVKQHTGSEVYKFDFDSNGYAISCKKCKKKIY